jgi:hypothetical protein
MAFLFHFSSAAFTYTYKAISIFTFSHSHDLKLKGKFCSVLFCACRFSLLLFSDRAISPFARLSHPIPKAKDINFNITGTFDGQRWRDKRARPAKLISPSAFQFSPFLRFVLFPIRSQFHLA